MFKLDNKVVVLIGGAGLLGIEFSKAILEQGGKLYSFDLKSNSGIDKLMKNKKYNFEILDASEKKELEKAKNDIVKKEKRVDVLINSTTSKSDDVYFPFEDISEHGWDIILKGNLTIPFISSQVFVKQMKKQKAGSIINISSIYGIVGNDHRIYEGSNLSEVYANKKSNGKIFSHCGYNASKGGLITFTKYLAAYYGKYNVRANCISPGGIDNGKENKTFLKNYSERVPMARKGRPSEINGAVVFLASDESSYINGHNLVVDGGYTAW